jgi:hypothetical protein
MIRPLLALERLMFLEPEGKVGYRYGRDAAELLFVDGKPGEALTAIDKAMSLTNSKDSLARFDGVKKKIKEALPKK